MAHVESSCRRSIVPFLFIGATSVIALSHRLDIGLGWFTRNFDVEKKPILAIGVPGPDSGFRGFRGFRDRFRDSLTRPSWND
jgi:hypothetical protein